MINVPYDRTPLNSGLVPIYPNTARIHALYYADKVCCEPLTPTFHLSDMRSSVRGYTEQVS